MDFYKVQEVFVNYLDLGVANITLFGFYWYRDFFTCNADVFWYAFSHLFVLTIFSPLKYCYYE